MTRTGVGGNAGPAVSLSHFHELLEATGRKPDDRQWEAVSTPPEKGLFIVAGPGSGKTNCLTLRILKLILVDGLPPSSVLATTFTKKAAAELRSRILSGGFDLIDFVKSSPKWRKEVPERLFGIDVNQVQTGTIDSICEQILRTHREPGTASPNVADEFVARTLLLREGLRKDDRDRGPDLEALLLGLHSGSGSAWGFNRGGKTDIVAELWDRRHHDLVDWPAFLEAGSAAEKQGKNVLDAALFDFREALAERQILDFSSLEYRVLERLREGSLREFTDDLRVVLVDEYQDTNLLQEAIYFEMAKSCGGALTVVGDDDQSLYRFRGATVELFRDFSKRYKSVFKRAPERVFLSRNYRSRPPIVALSSDLAMLDPGFKPARVAGKPALEAVREPEGATPVLGMFRPTIDALARDLAGFVWDVFRGKGFRLPDGKRIHRAGESGDLGDCALLCSSPAEYAKAQVPPGAPPKPPRKRLPLLLKEELGDRKPAIAVFNPRGEDFTEISLVAHFGGLLLECLDPGGPAQGTMASWLPARAQAVFAEWRSAAVDLADSTIAPRGLRDWAVAWADRDPKKTGHEWPRSTPALDLVYGLRHFFPALHDDPEGQVYFEVFTRQLSAASQVGKFEGRVVTNPAEPGLSEASVRELLRDFLAPIAEGVVDLNEELIEAFPRDRLNILSIHQSKGLEFPLTIVDVGSDFKDRRSPPFKRFPNEGARAHRMEDLLRPFTTLHPDRDQVDRAFDDLVRQYFVAFSRAQDVLLLVGVDATAPGGRVENVATGWIRSGRCAWAGRRPPVYQAI
jgi:DNA helicase-2/ATP-dependent DNA helicase PcrA